MRAVCLRCGRAKSDAPAACPNCGFLPQSRADLAKSFILSSQFDVGDSTIGRVPAELSRIATDLERGVPYEFDDAEVARAEAQIAAFRAIHPRKLLIDLIKWLGPALLILVAVFLLLKFKSGWA